MQKNQTVKKKTGTNAICHLPADYGDWLNALKRRIASARQRAILAANEEQIRLYHDIGFDILDRQSRQGWGAKVIEQVSTDLRTAFPDMRGFSARNLKYMSYFAKVCPQLLIGQQPAAQLPWFHIVTLLTKVSDPTIQDFLDVNFDSRSRATSSSSICFFTTLSRDLG